MEACDGRAVLREDPAASLADALDHTLDGPQLLLGEVARLGCDVAPETPRSPLVGEVGDGPVAHDVVVPGEGLGNTHHLPQVGVESGPCQPLRARCVEPDCGLHEQSLVELLPWVLWGAGSEQGLLGGNV